MLIAIIIVSNALIIGAFLWILLSNRRRYNRRLEIEKRRKIQEELVIQNLEIAKHEQEKKFKALLQEHQDTLDRLRNLKNDDTDKPFSGLASITPVEQSEYNRQVEITKKLQEDKEVSSEDEMIAQKFIDSKTPLED